MAFLMNIALFVGMILFGSYFRYLWIHRFEPQGIGTISNKFIRIIEMFMWTLKLLINRRACSYLGEVNRSQISYDYNYSVADFKSLNGYMLSKKQYMNTVLSIYKNNESSHRDKDNLSKYYEETLQKIELKEKDTKHFFEAYRYASRMRFFIQGCRYTDKELLSRSRLFHPRKGEIEPKKEEEKSFWQILNEYKNSGQISMVRAGMGNFVERERLFCRILADANYEDVNGLSEQEDNLIKSFKERNDQEVEKMKKEAEQREIEAENLIAEAFAQGLKDSWKKDREQEKMIESQKEKVQPAEQKKKINELTEKPTEKEYKDVPVEELGKKVTKHIPKIEVNLLKKSNEDSNGRLTTISDELYDQETKK